MKYTSYFNRVLKSQGCPHLNPDEFAVYMNIVHLEGRIYQLEDLILKEKRADLKNLYTYRLDVVNEKVTQLTGGLEPKNFMIRLIKS